MAEIITFEPFCYGETFLEWSFVLTDKDGAPVNIDAVSAIMKIDPRSPEVANLNPVIDGNKITIPQFDMLFPQNRYEADVFVTISGVSDCFYKLIFHVNRQTSKQ
jgi:hypothetical protein